MRKLKIIRTLEYYDVPQLLVAEDAVGMRYLCLLYDMEDNGELKYISVIVSEGRLNDFIKGRIDLLSTFKTPELDGAFYKVKFIKGNIIAEPFSEDAIEEFMLPESGYFYDDSIEEDTEMISRANSTAQPVIRLAFENPQGSHDIDALCLSAALTHFQSMVNNSYRRLYKEDSVESKLRVTTFMSASFDIELTADEKLDMFGQSRVGRVLEVINELFSSDADKVGELLRQMKGFAVSSYKNFIDVLYENELTLNMKWVFSSLDSDVRRSVLKKENVRILHETINTHSELQLEEEYFDGCFTAANTDNGKWTFKSADGKEIRGDSDDYGLLYGITLLDKAYRITCGVQQVLNDTTLKGRLKYKLTAKELLRGSD